MSIWKRLRIYFIGFGMGTLLVYGFFGERACGGCLPKDIIRNSIKGNPFMTSQYMDCKLKCNNITNENLVDFVEKGTINLAESVTKPLTKEYVFEYQNKKLIYMVIFDSIIYIKDYHLEECIDCDTLSKRRKSELELPFAKK